jgi:D-glycero-D-manno-heptose 1,7-bisphosphate phosphatase
VTERTPPQAILLDRDGVLVEPVPDPQTGTNESPLHPQDVRLVDGAAGAVALIAARGLPVFVCSNQPAAAKGTVPMSELEAVHERTVELLGAEGVTLTGWRYCYHHPNGVVPELTGECECRKPSPGMLTETLAEHRLEPARCWMVGDADTDVIAGRRAGTMTALLEHPLTAHRRGRDAATTPDLRVSDLREFADRVLASEPSGDPGDAAP